MVSRGVNGTMNGEELKVRAELRDEESRTSTVNIGVNREVRVEPSIVRCHECMYWSPIPWAGMGECESDKFISGDVSEVWDEITDDCVLVKSRESHPLPTGPMFGCVHGRRAE